MQSVPSRLAHMLVISVVMYLLLIYIIFLPFQCIAGYSSDGFRGRLEQIPDRIVDLSRGLWGDNGIPDWLTDIYVPLHSPPHSLCRAHSQIYGQALHNFTLWAFQMFDSSSKLQSGLLYAHFKDLGSFDECIDVDPISPFKVQQCLVELRGIVKYPKVPGDLDDVETIVGGLPLLKPHLGLSMCVPASCSRSDLLVHYNEVFSHLNLTPIMNQYSCSTKDPAPMTTIDWAVGLLCGGIFLLVIITSIFDITANRSYKMKAGGFWKLLECFSTRKTLCHIVSKKDPNKPLASLRGLRFLCVLWIVYSHNYACVAFQPTLNWIHIYNMMENVSGAIFLNGKCAVDAFLVMSGLLLCYIFLDMMESGRKFNIGLFYLHRIVRILPMYFVVVFLGITFYPRYASGPQWNHLVRRHEQNCRDHWWTNMLFVNNYIHTDRQCNPQTWYLAVDMQLYILSPLILFPVYKWRMFRRVGLPILVLISMIIAFCISYSHQIPAGSIIARDLQTMESYSTEYITTHTRFGSWIIGIALGYLLYQTKNTKIKLSKIIVYSCWLFSLLICSSILFGITYFNQPEHEYNRVQSAIYTSLHSPLWSLATGWMIFACETGYADPLKSILTSRILQPLGNLSFAIYLLHGSFQFVLSAMMRTPAYLDFMPNMVTFLGVVVLTAGSGLLFSVLFELPFMNLEYVLTRRGEVKVKKIPEKNGNDIIQEKSIRSVNTTKF